MTPLEAYLTVLREIRSSGQAVVETSYYGATEDRSEVNFHHAS